MVEIIQISIALPHCVGTWSWVKLLFIYYNSTKWCLENKQHKFASLCQVQSLSRRRSWGNPSFALPARTMSMSGITTPLWRLSLERKLKVLLKHNASPSKSGLPPTRSQSPTPSPTIPQIHQSRMTVPSSFDAARIWRSFRRGWSRMVIFTFPGATTCIFGSLCRLWGLRGEIILKINNKDNYIYYKFLQPFFGFLFQEHPLPRFFASILNTVYCKL